MSSRWGVCMAVMTAKLAQCLGSAELVHRCCEVGLEAEACMAVPRAVPIPCSLVEASPSDHSLHSPDLTLPPEEPLAMSPPRAEGGRQSGASTTAVQQPPLCPQVAHRALGKSHFLWASVSLPVQ